jgi:hypothetical protein
MMGETCPRVSHGEGHTEGCQGEHRLHIVVEFRIKTASTSGVEAHRERSEIVPEADAGKTRHSLPILGRSLSDARVLGHASDRRGPSCKLATESVLAVEGQRTAAPICGPALSRGGGYVSKLLRSWLISPVSRALHPPSERGDRRQHCKVEDVRAIVFI